MTSFRFLFITFLKQEESYSEFCHLTDFGFVFKWHTLTLTCLATFACRTEIQVSGCGVAQWHSLKRDVPVVLQTHTCAHAPTHIGQQETTDVKPEVGLLRTDTQVPSATWAHFRTDQQKGTMVLYLFCSIILYYKRKETFTCGQCISLVINLIH